MKKNQLVKCGSVLLALWLAPHLWAQNAPTWGAESSPSPAAGSGVSKSANGAADKAMYKDVEYTNAAKMGPQLIVLPGEVKSNNATFVQKFGANNIADYAELELTKANFQVLERADLGPMLSEIQLAYSVGDPDQARKVMTKGKLKTTKWIIKFDILKAEQSRAERPQRQRREHVDRKFRCQQSNRSLRDSHRSIDPGSAIVWVVGMRYKILDASTTEEVAQGYAEEKMEVGPKSTSVAVFHRRTAICRSIPWCSGSCRKASGTSTTA